LEFDPKLPGSIIGSICQNIATVNPTYETWLNNYVFRAQILNHQAKKEENVVCYKWWLNSHKLITLHLTAMLIASEGRRSKLIHSDSFPTYTEYKPYCQTNLLGIFLCDFMTGEESAKFTLERYNWAKYASWTLLVTLTALTCMGNIFCQLIIDISYESTKEDHNTIKIRSI
jgi:hypothetical protein